TCFLKQQSFYFLWIQFLLCIQEISEPVNGSATLKCPVNKNRAVEFVYFQKGDFFVNGHHSENHITGKWNNTKMDKNFTFYMYNLERSQSGHYKCIIMYKNDKDPVIHEYNLTVTVPYSKPSFTKECNKRNDIRSCQVTCMAQDGYPSQKIWIVLVQSGNDNNGMVTSRNDSVFNLTTKLFSSTVTVEFNCSNTEVEFVCSVGGVVSETISIYILILTARMRNSCMDSKGEVPYSHLTNRVWREGNIGQHHSYVMSLCNLQYSYKYFTIPYT
uniref:Immunoglobulin-like beta-sandwich domain-containing protein n=1 Tax=Oryzias sinensis TaxID=183150 RepID=A0A8C7X5M1_9TELE